MAGFLPSQLGMNLRALALVKVEEGQQMLAAKIEHPPQNVRGIAGRFRDDNGTKAGHLIMEIVQPGQAAAVAEVARIRPVVDGGNGHHEPHPISARQQAGTPARGKVKRGLGRNQP